MRKCLVQMLMIFVLLAFTVQAKGGGLYLYEIGTEDLGLANAGSGARAQDASTIASNPAGMTYLEGNQLTVGAQIVYGDLDYTMDNESLEGPGNVVGWLPGASTFYSHSISNDLKLGVGVYGNYGLSLSFDDNWAGHNLVKEATLMGLTLQPSLAYRMNDWWSFGVGLGINYGIFSLTRDKLIDGNEVELDDTDLAPNVKIGFLFEPSDATRLGLAYTSKVDYEFKIDATGTLPGPAARPWSLPVKAMTDAPQQAMISVVHVLNDKWSILGEAGWQDWSTLSETEISVGNVTQSSKLNLQDTWHGSVGGQYRLSSETRLNFGIAYDTSMYKDQDDTSLALPAGAAWRFGTGVQQTLNDRSSFGVAFEYMMSEDAQVASPDVLSGSYNNPQMYFVAVNYNYRF